MKNRSNERPILVVEDDNSVCEIMTLHLEDAGYSVICATSDREAYALLSKRRAFCALIADIHLGVGTTGYDVARFARQLMPGLPVIYLSGASSMRSFSAFGVPDSTFFEKPFDTPALIAALEAKVKKDGEA